MAETTIASALIRARTASHLTQKQLAARSGIRQSNISRIENGTINPTVSTLKRLAEAMGMSLRIDFVEAGCTDGTN